MECTNPMNVEFGKRVPCGRCISCRINRGQEWSTRILHEMELFSDGLFITLTYDDEHIPKGGTLVKAHLQGFIKRYRNRCSVLRYYGVGEYGDSSNRPHYHLIVMGELDSFDGCWDFGFTYVGNVEWDSVNYVTSYVQKKLYGNKAKEVYQERLAPFAIMSKGMGLKWLLEHREQIMLHLGVRRHGKTVMAPRYYFKKIGDEIPIDVWNRRAIITAEVRMANRLAEGATALEFTERERRSRRQKACDQQWKGSNAGPKGIM